MKPWKAPIHLEDLVEPVDGELSRFRHSQEYLLLEERAIPKKELKPGPNMVSLLFALEQSRDEKEIQSVLDRFWHWLEPEELTEIQRAFAAWISRVALHTRPRTKAAKSVNLLEVRTMLAERLKRRDEKLLKKGLEQGLEQGHGDIVRNMSRKGLEPKEICNFTGLSLSEVKKLLAPRRK